ncbi:FAD binding domain-containing protein [Nocardiopsis coralliicola]
MTSESASPVRTAAEAAAVLAAGTTEPRAGGTDTTARGNAGLAAGPFTDLLGLPELGGVEWAGGGARLGAAVPVARLSEPDLAAAYPALAAAAGALATPQVRAVATLGGNLLQRNRCWYFRNPAFSCRQDGGSGCPARTGDHRHGTLADGDCVAVHPSTLAMALLLYGAEAEVVGSGGSSTRPVAELYDAGSAHDHALGRGEILSAVLLPEPVDGERAAYKRATGRSRAEWPLVEAVARALPGEGGPKVRVAAGAVARTPLRLHAVEDALAAGASAAEAAARAADAVDTARPLPGTRYKSPLLQTAVRDVLEQVLL